METGNRELWEFIDGCPYMTLGIKDEAGAFPLPISFGREGNHLYFHSAKGGRKFHALKDRAKGYALFVESGEKTLSGKRRALTVRGEIVLLRDREEKEKGLRLLCRRYVPGKEELIPAALRIGTDYTAVFRLDVEELGKVWAFGKRNGLRKSPSSDTL